MSERRTAEIKFRCTPTFKASLAAAAVAADQSLTEFIESAVRYAVKEQESWQEGAGTGKVRAIGVSDLCALLEADCCAGHPVNADAPCDDCPLVGKAQSEYGAPNAPALSVAPPQTKCAGNCRPWEFCRCKASA